MRPGLRAAALLGGMAAPAIAIVGGCFSQRPAEASDTRTSVATCTAVVAAGAVQAVVAIKNFAFSPDTLQVPRGTTVTWVNCDAAGSGAPPHTTTSDGNLWTSTLLASADTYSRVFDQPGAYPYHCTPHPFMKATVIVQ